MIKASALAGVGSLAFPYLSLGRHSGSAADKVNLAFIGVGGRGEVNVEAFAKENIVAFCDVDEEHCADTLKAHPDVPLYKDYRVMLDKEASKIDAVVITTPDHMHYPIAMWAIANGKHVYLEKPLTRCIHEARELRKAASKAGVITQMGNQGHAAAGLRLVKEWYQAGILGEVSEVYHWTNRPIWPQGNIGRVAEKVPASLDYALWLGVAPKKPYASYITPFGWRGWRDYGCGSIGDMASHILDSSYSGLGLAYPKWVDAQGTQYNEETFPTAMTVQMLFERGDGKPDVFARWYEGGPKPFGVKYVPNRFFIDQKKYGLEGTNGSLLVGEEVTLYVDTFSRSVRMFPEGKFDEIKRELPPKTIPRIKGGPQAEFANAIREGRMPGSNFDYAAPFTEVGLLGNIAMFAGRRIEYDPVKMRISNYSKANKYLYSNYDYNESFLPG